MIRLTDFKIEENELITHEKIFRFCNDKKNEILQYIKTDFIKNRNSNIVTISNWRDLNKKIDLNKIQILISGHSDYEISYNELDILNNNNLKIWIAENKNLQHSKLFSLPIGLNNKEEPNSYIHDLIGNLQKNIPLISKTPKNIKNLVYMNFSIETFPYERQKVYDLYKNESWVTNDVYEISENGHINFLNKIYSHKFIFAPRGNGIDTHRLWESLYLRSIPIVKKCIGMEDFYDLPILFVDDWENITEDFLNEKYEEIISKEYPLYKLKIGYWFEKITNILEQ